MVNMLDSEKIIKHMVTQFCDQQFKFTLNLKILGSIHVIVDNNEVLTCLLDEKYYKPNVGRGLIIPNNTFNPANHMSIPSSDHTLNLVNTLSQLQQQQRCGSKMSVSTTGKSSKSSSSTHSSSSSSSSSSYISSVLTDQSNQEPMNALPHKRKRLTSKSAKSDDGGSIKKENGSENETEDVSEDEANGIGEAGSGVPSSLSNNLQRMTTNDTQNTDEMDDMNGGDSLNASSSEIHGKRNKLDTEFESQVASVNSNSNPTTYSEPISSSGSSVVGDAEAAAAATLSLISVASKLSNHHHTPSSPMIPIHESNEQNPMLNTNTNTNTNADTNVQRQSTTIGQNFKNKKSKIKSIIEEYNKNEQFQLQLQQQEQARAIENSMSTTINAIASGVDNHFEQANQQVNSNGDNLDESNCSDQLFMDEGHDDVASENPDGLSNISAPSSSNTPSNSTCSNMNQTEQQRQQHHQLMMVAAAAAIINNNNNNNPNMHNGGEANKLFMPQLALNLAAAKQQQQNVQIPKKKKQRQNSMMSPSSSTSSSSVTSSHQASSAKSISSASSTTSTSSKSSKKARQTVAALAAAATTTEISPTQSETNQLPSQPNELQRNLAALAQQFKEHNNHDQQTTEQMNVNNEKSKLLFTHTPQPSRPKLSKKAHLLNARSANNSPTVSSTKVQKLKKEKKSQLQDTSNLANAQNMAPSNSVAQAAAAAAYRYQQLLSQVNTAPPNNAFGFYNNTPQKCPEYPPENGHYPAMNNIKEHNDDVENEETENCDEKEINMNQMTQNMGTAGSINFKSLTNNANLNVKQELPLNTMNNQSNLNSMSTNLEFECSACDKRFKYYCYYKRHMDACHSDNPKYVCDTCNKSYKWEASFRQHLRSNHGIKQDGMENQQNGFMDTKTDNMYQNSGENNFQKNENQDYDDQEYNEDEANENEYNEYQSQESQEQQNSDGINAHHPHVGDVRDTVRDTEQMGAAGALASIADSIHNMIHQQTQQMHS